MLNDLKDNLEKKQRLINFLLECPSFKNKHDFLIRELPHYISNAIENNEQPRIRMFNIVSTCSLYNDGFEQLFKVLKSFDGNTIPFNKMVDEFIVPETKETVKSMKLNEALAEWKKVEELAPNSSQVSSEIQRLVEKIQRNEIQDKKDNLSKLCGELQQKNKEFERLVNNLSSRLNEKEQQELKELFNNYLEFTHKFCEDLSEAEQFEKGKKERIELFKSLGQT